MKQEKLQNIISVPTMDLNVKQEESTGQTRREFLKYAGGFTALLGLSATSLNCVSLVKRAENLVFDYALIVNDENNNVYRLKGKIDSNEEKEGYKILQNIRPQLENDLVKHLDEQSMDKFINALYNKKDFNKAATTLYQNFQNGDIKDYSKLGTNLMKVDPYLDPKDVFLVALTAASITVGALYVTGVLGSGSSTGGGVIGGGGATGPGGGGGGV